LAVEPLAEKRRSKAYPRREAPGTVHGKSECREHHDDEEGVCFLEKIVKELE